MKWPLPENQRKVDGSLLLVEFVCRTHWPRGPRYRLAAARLLSLWVRILPGAWIFVCCECCVLGKGLSDGLITCPEESYLLLCIVMSDLETL